MRENIKGLAVKTGCLLFVLVPAAGAVFHPSMDWLLAIPLALVAVAAINFFSKGPDAVYYAERAERLLTEPRDWDVDDYESIRPRNPQLRILIQRTFAIGGRS
jgi:hypothetical protein